MRSLKFLIDSDQAASRLRSRRFSLLRRSADGSPSRKHPHLDLVWMPFYLIAAETLSKRGLPEAQCLVDAYFATTFGINLHGQAVEENVDRGGFPPRLSEEEAEVAGRSFLLASLNFRALWRKPIELGKTQRIELVHYPYWVDTYERRPGKFDIRILDAVSGSKAGSGLKRSILAAFSDEAEKSPIDRGAPH